MIGFISDALKESVKSFFSTIAGKSAGGVSNMAGNLVGFEHNLDHLKRNSNRLIAILFDVETQVMNGEMSGKKKRKREVEVWLDEVQKMKERYEAMLTELDNQESFAELVSGSEGVVKLNSRIEELIQQSKDFGELLVENYECSSRVDSERLDRTYRKLVAIAFDVEMQVMNGEKSGKLKRKREVEIWLEEVQEIRNKYQTMQTHNEMVKLNSRIKELIQQSKAFGELLLDILGSIKGEPLVTSKLIGAAFEKNLQTISEKCLVSRVPLIGIYGMGGVGKTTLAKHIHNRLLKKDRGNVHWVTVSQEYRVAKLQQDIAKAVGIDLSDKTDETHRAARLYGVLSQMKGFVLILDDVWDDIRLKDDVGVPVGNEGSKVIITTRSLEVCRQIGCNEKFQVDTLNKKEAWDLFQERLGEERTLIREIEKIAKLMTKECDGLPLGIITVAASMRGEISIHVWRDALEKLKSSVMECDGWEDKVFRVLKYSFDRLDDKLKRCFLYCSLFPEDFPIPKEDLIKKFISEKLMDTRKRRAEEFDQGHAILDKLVNLSLLEIIDRGYRVKMHDLIRDMALMIAKINPKFKVLAGLWLKKIPDEQDWPEDIEKMSLMLNQIPEIPVGMSPTCPKLSTLLLNINDRFTSIPDSFFKRMLGLQVLDLSQTNIQVLPDSLTELARLSSLVLRHCNKLVRVPNLGKLEELLELDFDSCGSITEVPNGMENLVKLKYLSFEKTNLEVFPTGLLPKLMHLQILLLPFTVHVQAEEAEMLRELEEFNGRLKDIHTFNHFVKSWNYQNRIQYRIQVSPKGEQGNYFLPHMRTHVSLNGCSLVNSSIDDDAKAITVMLPHDIEHLNLNSCDGLSNCFVDDVPRLNNPRFLKMLSITDCNGIECILRMSSISTLSEGDRWESLHTLEKIHLLDLSDLKSVIEREKDDDDKVGGSSGAGAATSVQTPPPPLISDQRIFSSLKNLNIFKCKKFKKLGLPLHDLLNLEYLRVAYCKEIEEIIHLSANQYSGGPISLPKLAKLELWDLPKLRSICEATMICNSLETIYLVGCRSLKKLPLFLAQIDTTTTTTAAHDGSEAVAYAPPPALKGINLWESDKEWWESLEMEHPSHKDVLQPLVKWRKADS